MINIRSIESKYVFFKLITDGDGKNINWIFLFPE